ncbi:MULTISPECIES: CaiB/BaiF CoA transferase family protein [unclassified Pseudomonas]|uniref:CaiB/BaiF CoA transferase family protein n=1 Tax=unclassified Pseudomonas TaxID=196821 RepID=UPI0025D70098|nr:MULTISPECIES: CoA transferase [unclassified Pseudomonas]
MYDVMQGIRVVEVAEHTFVPAAGMVLADWGAEVIKVERMGGGDASRHLKLPGTDGRINPFFEAANRGKRGITLDLTQEAGREELYRLLETADVFITNLRDEARSRLGIQPADLMSRHPRLIYGLGTGYGRHGEMANDGGYDYPSSWCRSGAAWLQTTENSDMPPKQPGSIGDLGGGLALAGAIAAALFRRERTGRGAVVENSLYLTGTYLASQSLLAASIGAPLITNHAQGQAPLALANNYQTRDGRWISLCLLVDKWWPDFLHHVNDPALAQDPRFIDATARHVNRQALVEVLNKVFAQRDYADWCQRLTSLEGVWAPVQSPAEVLTDPQALVNGFVSAVDLPGDARYLTGVSAAQFDERPIGALQAAPGYCQHTDQVLSELGVSAQALVELRRKGAIG